MLNIQQQTWAENFKATHAEFREARSTPHKLTSRFNRNPNWVQPNESDFLCDYELQARRALVKDGDWSRYWLFMAVFVWETKKESSVDPEVIDEMRWKVGRELRGTMLSKSHLKDVTFHWYKQGKMVNRAKR